MSIPGVPTRVLVAPDSFKGSFTAAQVARAIGAGLEAAGRPVDLCPVADGGEGTLAALREALGTADRVAEVSDPLGRPVAAGWGLGDGVAVIETASASGLDRVPEAQRDALAASTTGTGELILEAVAHGARTIYLGVGGSATTDGGRGAVQAIDAGGGLQGARLVILCDVRTAFEDAARVFGPQKGADPDQVRRLTRRLHGLARGMARDPRGAPMTGAAGGLSGGLWAAYGAELVSGAGYVLDRIGFDARMRAARAVVCGEGRLDGQSLTGKAVAEVATRARQAGVPCHAIVARHELDSFGVRILDLQTVREARTLPALRAAGRALADAL